jgi:hypothetical protein
MTWRDGEGRRMSFEERYGQYSELVEQLVDEFTIRCSAHIARRFLDSRSRQRVAAT